MKAITRAERDRTVLLLRCAAEIALTGGDGIDTCWTSLKLGFGRDVAKQTSALATRATRQVARELGRDPKASVERDEYVAVVLEAARRLEERSWP